MSAAQAYPILAFADKKSPKQLYLLALITERGLGLPHPDKTGAAELYSRLAEQNSGKWSIGAQQRLAALPR